VDTFLPFTRLKEFLEWYAKDFGHFPLWVVPYARVHDYEWAQRQSLAKLDDRLMVDIAIYGMKQRGDTNYYRLMEEKLQELNGVKTLISYNYYKEDEFWRIFNRAKLRQGQGCHRPRQHLPQPLREDLPRGDGRD